jgi:hypothetical protein
LVAVGLRLAGEVDGGRLTWLVARKVTGPVGCLAPDLSVGLVHFGGLMRSLTNSGKALCLITVLPRSEFLPRAERRSLHGHRVSFLRKERWSRGSVVSYSRPFVIGVDCHARTHTYAILDARTGQQIGCEQFPSTSSGSNRAISWVNRHAGGDLGALWVIEGIGTYGARLARAAAQAGYDVVEAPRMSSRTRRGIGKSDPLDAAAIAVAVLGLEESRLRRPRQDEGVRAALRTLASARDQLTRERTVNINALTALVRVNDLGIDARKPLTAAQILTITRWREREEPLEAVIAREEAIRLARRITEITAQLDANHKRMTGLIQQSPLLHRFWALRASVLSRQLLSLLPGHTPTGSGTRPLLPPWPA